MKSDLSIRAKWIWTGEGKPIADGGITVREGRIVSVDANSPLTAIDLGEYCILPGWINSHTHLEFSDLSEPVEAGCHFADWIRKVVARRRAQGNPHGAADARAKGLRESGAAGVRLVLDVVHPLDDCHSDTIEHLYSESNPAVIPFAELIGTTAQRADATWRGARRLRRKPRSDRSLGLPPYGLNPHAPYTTTAKLIRQAVRRCQRWNVPIMFHLAESIDELRWIETGDGPLQELLESVVGNHVLSSRDRLSIAGYIDELCRAPRAYVIHGNFLDEPSIHRLASSPDRAAVVYCPRTHAHFALPSHPLPELRRRGIRVVLGTDSRASNPDLSMLDEGRQVRHDFPELPAEAIFAMMTSEPAAFLGIDRDRGSLLPGRLAELNAVACAAKDADRVLDEILESEHRIEPVEAILAHLSIGSRIERI